MRKSQHKMPVNAVIVFSYVRKGNAKFFGVCGDCADTIETQLKANSAVKEIDKGPICPCCDGTGFQARFRHIDKGVCYRCNGKGHW